MFDNQNRKSAATPASFGTVSASGDLLKDATVLEFSDKSSFNLGLFVLWLVAVFSVVATVFIWFMGRSLADEVVAKQSSRDSALSQLNSPENTEIEKKANDFKSSVNTMSNSVKESRSLTKILPKVYGLINKDIVITNMTLSGDNSMSFTGKTGSYYSVSQQVMTLKKSDFLSDIKLTSALASDDENNPGVLFSISAKLIIKSAEDGGAQTSNLQNNSSAVATPPVATGNGGSN